MNTLTILIYIGSLISSLELILGSFIILSTLGFIFYLLSAPLRKKPPK
jgi:hypothetical protein